jgi:5-formyltetrahydrofolate cyclo-ligase
MIVRTLRSGELRHMPKCGLSKKDLRIRLQTNLAVLTADEVHQRSRQACNLLFAQPEFERAETIMVFLSLPTELNTAPLVLRAWQLGKRVLAPRVSQEQRRMMPIEIRSLPNHIEDTQWNLRQPLVGNPVPLSTIDLVVVPGLGFDQAGNRLGRGGGFYDRFLARAEFAGSTCAVGFEQQVLEVIPTDPHDIRVDMLVTEQHVQRFV